MKLKKKIEMKKKNHETFEDQIEKGLAFYCSLLQLKAKPF
jgi:hypothetical protein